LHRWETPAGLLAGQDLLSGGTWLGVSEQDRFAVVTNLRGYGPPRPEAPSRGLLLRDWLGGEGRYANLSLADLPGFSPFNLLTLEAEDLSFWTNRPNSEHRHLTPGVYGLSNGALDEPWPKTVQLKAILSQWLEADSDPHALLAGLAEDTLPAMGRSPAAPSDVALEPPQSPIFIRNALYGTRCSSVVAVDHDGAGVIIERRFDAGGAPSGETALSFRWPQ
jgi:uncharacterized protein with NRDE domain